MSRSAKSNFELPFALRSDGTISTILAGKVSPIYWPDGRWCFAANAFLVDLIENNKSTIDGGGTITTYASQVNHLVTYCYSRGMDFLDLTDNDFTDFVFSLSRNSHQPAVPERNATTVLNIGRLALRFLDFLGRHLCDTPLVGAQGKINAEIRQVKDRRRHGWSAVWHHRSFPAPEPVNNKKPIGTDSLEALKAAAIECSGSHFILMRRLVMILLLEVTGCRRAELNGIKTHDIRRALRLSQPMLRVPSLKKGGNRIEMREIPVNRSDLEFVDEYIEVSRRVLRRQLGFKGEDAGFLFLNARTGRQLTTDTITAEFRMLGRQAGLRCAVSPHLLRHRFITKIFVAIRERYRFESADEFTRALQNNLALQRELRQWTGHRSAQSLYVYIDATYAAPEIKQFVADYLRHR
ncbi:tyrosine-type recombinase/integrase [Kordiimonas aestuarii]|uniref:tyrosine-type recombinase/integrase n=1 Tax=Kordiimonas aestuarii TaxID=1005925 RepID=UPI0021D05107|nr:site-specific integrase [Kordiimonas aestuarii]